MPLVGLAGPASADPLVRCCGGGGGGGGCSYTSVPLFAYGGEAQVTVNGTSHIDGTYFLFCIGVPYSIGVSNVQPGYTFHQWISNSGTFANPGSASTVFTPQSAPLQSGLSAVLFSSYSNGQAGWSGYEISTYAGSPVISSVSGSFQVPSTSYTSCSICTNNQVAIWMGIGGSFGNLAQAGIGIGWYLYDGVPDPLCTPCYWAFYEDVGKDLTPTYYNSLPLGPGDQVSITVSTSNGHASYSVGVYTGTWSYWNPPAVTFTPDQTTAEWVAEDPSNTLWVLPNTGTLSFFSPAYTEGSTTFYNFLGPVLAMQVTHLFGNPMKTQCLTPGGLAAPFNVFSIAYSQS